MRAITTVGLVCTVALCFGQGAQISRKTAWAILVRHTVALGKAIPGITASEKTGDATPITRAELILEMGRIFDQAKPKFRWTPVYSRMIEVEIVKNNPDPAVQGVLRKLERYSCVGPVGPLVIGPGTGLTPAQFGDSLAYFNLRITQLCHQPDPKWTPDLQSFKDEG